MFIIRVELRRNSGDFGFEIKDSLNHLLQTDSGKETGGDDAGFRPMQLLLAALASCSAIDIVSILKKQRQDLGDIRMLIEAEREQGLVPALWKKVVMHVSLEGNLEEDKALRAVELSITKYCSVAETLRRSGTEITFTVKNIKA